MRRHVASAARIGVIPPRPPELARALEQDEVPEPLLSQADRHPETAEAGSDDREAEVIP